LTDHNGSICWPDCDAFECTGQCDGDGSCAPAEEGTCDPTCGSYCEAGGGNELGCDALYECLVGCEGDEECQERCEQRGSETGVRHLEAMLGCFAEHCADEQGDAWQECVYGHCDAEIGVCFAGGCLQDEDCPAGHFCDGQRHACVSEDELCTPDNPTGICRGPQICREGECVDFECLGDANEPNDEVGSATELLPGALLDGEVCGDDTDWLTVTVPPGHFGTVLLHFSNRVGDLELDMFDGDEWLSNRWHTRLAVPRSQETDEEGEAFLAGPAARTLQFQVSGWEGASNAYTVETIVQPWGDGAICEEAGFTLEECRGCDAPDCAVGSAHPPQLILFPWPDPDDPYVGDAYAFDSYTNYGWIRRELAMLVRYALHEVQGAFGQFSPLGLIDMAQHDAITPGYDVGDPRHPETTHDGGGNLDIAYFQDPEQAPDNRARIVCGDGSEHGDGFCGEAATERHFVDLAKQAYFMAMLCTHPRMRVIGVDRVLAPLIIDALRALAVSEHPKQRISAELAERTEALMAYGDGWPFHHHHIHVSMFWWFQCSVDADCPAGYGCRGQQCSRQGKPGAAPDPPVRRPAEGDAFQPHGWPLFGPTAP